MSHSLVTRYLARVDRQLISSGAEWETRYGYSRAVRVRNQVFVCGTVGRNVDGSIPHGVYAQAKRAFEIIEVALGKAGATWTDVVRTRTFLTDINLFDEMARAHSEIFRDIRPAATCVEVSGWVSGCLVEIEVDAIVE